jgi:type VI secretion system protein VasI
VIGKFTKGMIIFFVAFLGLVVAAVVFYPPSRSSRESAPASAAGLQGPQSKWQTSTSISPVDDSKTVVLQLEAEKPVEGWPGTVHTPTLILRCQEKELDAYLNVGMQPNVESDSLYGATVLLRFDKEPAQTHRTGKSTDGEALFFSDPTEIIRLILQHDQMLFRFTPFNSNPQETFFDLKGLREIIRPLREACGWWEAQEIGGPAGYTFTSGKAYSPPSERRTSSPDEVAPVAQPVSSAATTSRIPVDTANIGAAPQELLLQITVRSAVWLSMEVDGKRWEGTLRSGETREAKATKSIQLTVGDAGAVDLMLNEKPVPPLGNRGEVKKITITP